MIVAVSDNGGQTLDRYTIWLDDQSCLGLSSDPSHPQGFSQWSEYVGNAMDIIKEHSETLIQMCDLPENVREHAIFRFSSII